MITLLSILAVWVLCGVGAYGITLGYFYGRFKDTPYDHTGIAATMALGGPIGLAVSIVMSNFCQYGVRYKL